MVNIIVLLIVFILPEIIFNTAMGRKHQQPQHITVYIHAFVYLLVFYLNYFLLIDKLLFRKKVFLYIIIALLLPAVITLINPIVHYFVKPGPPRHEPPLSENMFMLGMMMRDYAMMILTTGLSVALKMGLRWNKIENKNRQIISEQQKIELANLKSQLNPHFLFNTLNNIYALIAINQDKAQDAVHRLSKMLRYMLYENVKEVQLEEELQFLSNYIELMKLRLNNYNRLEVDFPKKGTEGLTISPMIFMSLVENAFKHGICGAKPSEISINVKIDGSTIRCRVVNSLFPKTDNDNKNSGIGIANMQRRLALLYPGRYKYESHTDGEKYVAEVSINLKPNKQ